MKKLIFLMLFACIAFGELNAQSIKRMDLSPLDLAVFRPDGQGSQPVARIIYSRPQKKDREIFGELVPYGKIWRTGANQSTELNAFKDLIIQGNKLAAGNYTLYTIPNEKEWTIIISSQLFTWGAYDYDESKDVMRFTVPSIQVDKVRDNFGIAFGGEKGKGKILLAWDQTEVSIDFDY